MYPLPRRKINLKRTVRRAAKNNKIESHAKRDLLIILYVVLTILSLLALTDSLGTFGEQAMNGVTWLVGKGAYALPFFFAGLAIAQFRGKSIHGGLYTTLGVGALVFGVLGIIHTAIVPQDMMGQVSLRDAGGFLGATASRTVRLVFGDLGAYTILMGITLVGAVFTFRISMVEIINSLTKKAEKTVESTTNTVRKAAETVNESLAVERERPRRRIQPQLLRPEIEPVPNEPAKPLVLHQTDWEGPSTELLDQGASRNNQPKRELDAMHEEIVLKLAEFGIGVDKTGYRTGPTVTQFRLTPHEGVKVNKISSLKSDLALALEATSVRVEAPIPGTSEIGIEVPNPKRSMVHLREILESPTFRNGSDSMLRMALGRDVNNDPVIADLGDMPHLLIAGATGSGKSVGLNTFLVSLLYQNSPNQLKLLLIDPKRVELRPYSGIPHLLTPVIVEADKALIALKWAVDEMMRRYEELAQHGCRNIAEYNQRRKDESEQMPKIIIVVDELADLMMRQFRKETEQVIARLAQMARAVGMHLIIATQRPSVDVITGLIKANIPTRIAFAVTSSIDSRTILDQTGAEDLLGRGDMLYSPPGLGKPIRVQGIYLDGSEITRVVSHLKEKGEPEYNDAILEGNAAEGVGIGGGAMDSSSGDGDVTQQAIEVIRSTGKASASLLQRRLSVGYARAARILDELEDQGLIGPANGAKPRDIYL